MARIHARSNNWKMRMNEYEIFPNNSKFLRMDMKKCKTSTRLLQLKSCHSITTRISTEAVIQKRYRGHFPPNGSQLLARSSTSLRLYSKDRCSHLREEYGVLRASHFHSKSRSSLAFPSDNCIGSFSVCVESWRQRSGSRRNSLCH